MYAPPVLVYVLPYPYRYPKRTDIRREISANVIGRVWRVAADYWYVRVRTKIPRRRYPKVAVVPTPFLALRNNKYKKCLRLVYTIIFKGGCRLSKWHLA